MRSVHGLICAVVVSTCLGGFTAANAASISGSFYLAGTAVGSTTGIDFYFASPGDQTAVATLPTTGTFTDLVPGTKETIQNLVAPPVIPGTSFDFMNWIQLSDGVNLDLTSIPIPSMPVCSASGSEPIGFECIVNAQSPVILTQNSDGVSAKFAAFGVAHTAGQTNDVMYDALFTAPSTNYATIAAFMTAFNAAGTIPAVGYSASFTTVPEPRALALAGAILLIGFGIQRRKRAV